MATTNTTDKNPQPPDSRQSEAPSFDSPFSSNPYDYDAPSTSGGYDSPYASSPSGPPATSSGRPTTSSGFGARPATAKINPFRQQPYQDQYGYDGGHYGGPSRAGLATRGGYGIEEEEEYYEEEESEDEGLFAFLPPSTAEQLEEREREKKRAEFEQQQQQRSLQVPGQGQGQAGTETTLQPTQAAETPFAYGAPTQQQQPPTTSSTTKYPYDPPVSPPSTESNEGSRAGVSTGDYQMTRLPSRKSEDAKSEAERNHRKSGSLSRRKSRDVKRAEDKDEANNTDGRLEDVELAQPTTAESTSAPAAQAFPKHFQHFQPNPARSNANSGPYKKHREYHYNQAYPQYAVATGTSHSSRLNTGTTAGGLPTTAGSRYSHGYGGDYADQERYRERKRSQRKRRKRKPDTGTTINTTATSDVGYGAGSEYSGARKGTGISEVDEGSISKSMYYEGDRSSRNESGMYDDEYEDGDSREGSIK